MSTAIRGPRWFLGDDGFLRCFGRTPHDTGHAFLFAPTADSGTLFPQDADLYPKGA